MHKLCFADPKYRADLGSPSLAIYNYLRPKMPDQDIQKFPVYVQLQLGQIILSTFSERLTIMEQNRSLVEDAWVHAKHMAMGREDVERSTSHTRCLQSADGRPDHMIILDPKVAIF